MDLHRVLRTPKISQRSLNVSFSIAAAPASSICSSHIRCSPSFVNIIAVVARISEPSHLRMHCSRNFLMIIIYQKKKGKMIKLFKVKERQREIAENANGRTPVKKHSAGELHIHKDISELNLPKTCAISFPNGKEDLMNFEVTIRPDEGLSLQHQIPIICQTKRLRVIPSEHKMEGHRLWKQRLERFLQLYQWRGLLIPWW